MYRTVETSFWDDPKVRKLDRDARLLFLYLITNRHTHVSGIYYVPQAIMELESGITRKALERGIDTLSKLRLAFFDRDRDVVFVRKMFGHQGRGEKNIRAAAKQLTTLHDSPLIGAFADEYPEVAERLSQDLLDRVSIGYPKLAVGTGTGTGTEGPSDPESVSSSLSLADPPDTSPSVTNRTELAWRVQQVWEIHLKARRRFFARENGSEPSTDPVFDRDDVEKPIREALRRFDRELLTPESRDEWRQRSLVRAAGIGIFYDPYMIGKCPDNDVATGGKRFLEPWRPWRPQRGKAHPVPRFAELYFQARDKVEAAKAS